MNVTDYDARRQVYVAQAPSFEKVQHLSSLGREYAGNSRDMPDVCQRLVHDQRLLHQVLLSYITTSSFSENLEM